MIDPFVNIFNYLYNMIINFDPIIQPRHAVLHHSLDVDVQLVRDTMDHVHTDHTDSKAGRGDLDRYILRYQIDGDIVD